MASSDGGVGRLTGRNSSISRIEALWNAWPREVGSRAVANPAVRFRRMMKSDEDASHGGFERDARMRVLRVHGE
jgi:hypothetical protein